MPKTTMGSWAFLFPLPLLSVKRAVWHTLRGELDGEEVALLAQLRMPLATSAKSSPPDKRILFPAPHSLPVLLMEERMSQGASTALGRETHFCPGLTVEPVSHRRKDRNSGDLSFRFHECWSAGTVASDGSNSVSISGAGWTRTKYSRPISSCRIGSGNISASRAYCERCAAIAAIFCWT